VTGSGKPGQPGAGFAQELKALAGEGAAVEGVPDGEGLPEGAAEALLRVLNNTAGAPAGPHGPDQAAVAGTPPQPLLDAVTDMPEQMGTAEAEPGETVDGLPGQLPDQDEVALAAMAPAHMVADSVPVAGGADKAAPLPSGIGPVSAASGAAGAALPPGGPQTGSAPAAMAPGIAAGAATGQAAAPVTGSGAAEPVAAASPVPSSTTPSAATSEQAAVTPLSAAPAGRRWQTELPQEFRAPVTLPVKTDGPGSPSVETQLTAVATVNGAAGDGADPADELVARLAGQPQPSGPQTGLTGAAAAQPQPAQAGLLADPAAAASAAADGLTANQSSAVNVNSGPAPAGATAQTPVTPTARPVSPAAWEVPLTAVPEEAVPVASSAEEGTVSGKPLAEAASTATVTKPAGAKTGPAAGEARQGASPQAAGISAAAPPAAAVLATGDEAELPLTPLEAASGTDFSTATVRGGELTGAMRTDSLQTPNQTQSAHVATQVAAEIARNLKNGQTQFQMRFDPPELGRVEVNMRVAADGSVQAHLIVERPETLDMFLRDQRGLERALEAAGLNTDSDNLQFSLKQEGGQDTAGDPDGRNGSSASGDGKADGPADQETDLTDRVRLMLAEQRGGLDMKV